MIFPIGDTNVQGGYKPIVCHTFIFINVVVFFIQISFSGNLVCELAAIPRDIIGGNNLFTLISSMFLHGGWMHLIGNMLFLWVFADNIEAIVGSKTFLIFYIAGGLFASATHIFFEFNGAIEVANCCLPCANDIACEIASQICTGAIPSLGASGAISAVMGAYIVMFPKSKIKTLFFVTIIYIPAFIFLGLWFGQQLVSGVGSLGPMNAQSSGVAWWAHIGGFVFGLVYGFFNRHKMSDISIVKSTNYG